MKWPGKEDFETAFKARLLETRLELDYSHKQMADELGIKEATYQKYETRPRSHFPLYLLARLVDRTQKPYSYWCLGMESPAKRFRVITRE